MTTIKEKKHRLDKEFYIGEKAVSFTGCIKNRVRIFINEEIFRCFENFLLESLNKFDADALIYLFMPDHLHLILQGKSESSNVLNSVNSFKQKTGFWFYKNMKEIKWQKDYFDHIIRNEKDIENQIYYILNNPVRAGIVENWKDYEYKGTTVYNLNELE